MLFAFFNRRFSSAGRAPALQAGGQRFDPVNLHLNDDSLAQLVEHLTFNQRVTGSSPVRVILICGFGGIGRRTRFRIWRLTAWGFKSLNPH